MLSSMPPKHLYVSPMPPKHLYVSPHAPKHLYVSPMPPKHLYVSPMPPKISLCKCTDRAIGILSVVNRWQPYALLSSFFNQRTQYMNVKLMFRVLQQEQRNNSCHLYRVIQEERSKFLEVIVSVTVGGGGEVHINEYNPELLPRQSCLNLACTIPLIFVCGVRWRVQFTKEKWIHETHRSLTFWMLLLHKETWRSTQTNNTQSSTWDAKCTEADSRIFTHLL
jgi:hypothetical protein